MAALDAVARFNAGEVHADAPFLTLTLTRRTCPRGDGVRLFGASGPRGRLCNVKTPGGGKVEVTATFPALAIIEALKARRMRF